MKNPNKKTMIAMYAVLLLQSGTTVFGMERAKTAYRAVRSKVFDRWQMLKGDMGKLQDALACINTNSCNAQQQAYIKSMVKKITVGIAASMAACGIYGLVKSKQYEGLKEDVAAARNIAAGFGVTNPVGIVFLENIKLFTDAVRDGNQAMRDAYYNKIIEMKGSIAMESEQAYAAAKNILKRYGSGDELTKKLIQFIGAAADISKKR